MKLTNEFNPVRKWAYKRGVYEDGDGKTQLLKVLEEVGEASRATLHNDRTALIDAIGDIVIALTNFTELMAEHFCRHCPECLGEGGEFIQTTDGKKRWRDCYRCSGLTIEYCINQAYNTIKTRKGQMKNGTFVKNKQK